MNEAKAKRTRKPASFTLQRIVELNEGEVATFDGELVALFDVATGFVSPEKAIEFAVSKKIQGMLRVVRVVSPIFEGSVVTPEPVYSLKKIDEMDEKPARKKRTKKQAVVQNTAATTITVTQEAVKEEWSIPDFKEGDEAAPVDDDIPPEDEAIPAVDPVPF